MDFALAIWYNKKEKLEERDLWMVLLASRTFQELYNVSSELLNKEMQDRFMREVINMSINKEFFKEWELVKLNEMVEYEKLQNAKNDGREDVTREYVINMLKENCDLEFISKITNKSKEEILEIKKELDKE